MIPLPGGAVTSRIGFGCAYILPETVGLLDAAYDAGIRHFDVARSYGRGLTELYVGRFLKGGRSDVTITTKYGIRPPLRHGGFGIARTLLRPFVRRLRRFKSVDSRITSTVDALYQKAAFDASDARASLHTSLKQLGRERVDIFLMHEAVASDLADEGLLRFLEDEVRKGTIGAFGVGGAAGNIPDLIETRPDFTRVLQYDWSPLDERPDLNGSFSIVYRVLGDRKADLEAKLAGDDALRRRCSNAIGVDLDVPGNLERLMMRASATERPKNLILFSSTKPKNIISNANSAFEHALEQPALKFVDLVKTINF